MTFPVSTDELERITKEACENAIGDSPSYDPKLVGDWNGKIINSILHTLISQTTPPKSEDSPSSADTASPYKFICNSTIIQHPASVPGAPAPRRGMHNASAAYWNSERDGSWSYKYDAAAEKGLEVVVLVTWIAL